ncbi:hypothetical protein ACJMK2_005200 [Sinanodonta woodiana]|uniref:Uncharacterized protein n=1 Tax=Sinanodonta woodiana TaxID=1069815 RepID=A0ABD3VPY4_SINWO
MAVEVREIRDEDEGIRTKRRAKMPKKKLFEFDLHNEIVSLNLTLNELVNDDAPMYVSENGNLSKYERQNTDEQYAFYQDQNTKASIMVRCNADMCKPLGTFSVKGKKYRLDINGHPIESTSLLTPVADPPNMIVSREGDMVILKLDPSKPVVHNETVVSSTPPSHPGQQGSREKRAIPTGSDIIEIMVYTDEVICSRFITLYNGNKSAGLEATRFYYALLINEMDTVYQPFQSHPSNTAGIDIRLFFSGIVVSCTEFYGLFYAVISARKRGHDRAAALAVYHLSSNTILGANHDEDVGCPLGYMMSAYATTGTLATATTQYQFSTCSVGDIQDTWCVKGQCVDKTTSGSIAPGNCYVYKTCVKQNKMSVGDGCCQGSETTNCCVLGRREKSCYVVTPCD